MNCLSIKKRAQIMMRTDYRHDGRGYLDTLNRSHDRCERSIKKVKLTHYR